MKDDSIEGFPLRVKGAIPRAYLALLGAILIALVPAGRAYAQAAPGNDDIATAQAVSGSSFQAAGDDTNATRELSEPAATGYNTLWYVWTAPANLNVTLTVSGTNNSVAVAVFQTGTSGPLNYGALNYIGSNNTYNGGATPTVTFQATANTTYVFSAGAEYSNGANGVVTLTLTSTPGGASWIAPMPPATVSPANDSLANARALSGSNLQVISYNASATTELAEPGVTGFNTVWYTWTAPANLNVTVSLASPNNSVTVAAFQTGTASPLTYSELNYINSADTSNNGPTPATTFKATAGTTYAFSVGAEYQGSAPGSTLFTLTSTPGDPGWIGPAPPSGVSPANDDVANAQVISGVNLEVVGYNAGATTELGEPAVSGYNTLWYSWTAPANLNVTLSLAGSYDSVALAAFQTGNPAAPNYSQLNYIASLNTLNGGATPTITFAASAGATYLFSVGAQYSGSPNGSTVLSMTGQPLNYTGVFYSPLPPSSVTPANDNFANARTLYGATVFAVSYNAGATTELGEPVTTGDNTVWYKWTAQETGPVTIASVYANFNHQISVFAGSGLNSLTQVGVTVSGVAGSGSVLASIGFLAVAHAPFYIAVGSQSASPHGAVILGIASPGTDYFANAGQFAGFLGAGHANFLKLAVTTAGALSGEAILEGRTIKLTGAFNIYGNYNATLDGAAVQLFDDPTGASRLLTGSVTYSGTTWPVMLQPISGAGAVAPGKYTLLVNPDGANGPQACGAGTLTVGANGSVTLAAHLADCTAVTAGGAVSSGSTWSLYIPLYNNAGYFAGTVNFQPVPGQSDFSGTFTWARPGRPPVPGFTAAPVMIGSAFTPGFPSLNLNAPATATFAGGALSGTSSYSGLEQLGAKVAAPGLTLSINKTSGIITGSFLPSGAAKALKVYGAVFQDQEVADGYFTDPLGNGSFTFGD